MVFGVLPLQADVLAFILLLGAVAGVLLGLKAPFRRREPAVVPEPAPSTA